MIAKGPRPKGTRKQLQRGSLTPTKDGVSSFAFDLNGLKLAHEITVELRGNIVQAAAQPGDAVRLLLFGARMIR